MNTHECTLVHVREEPGRKGRSVLVFYLAGKMFSEAFAEAFALFLERGHNSRHDYIIVLEDVEKIGKGAMGRFSNFGRNVDDSRVKLKFVKKDAELRDFFPLPQKMLKQSLKEAREDITGIKK